MKRNLWISIYANDPADTAMFSCVHTRDYLDTLEESLYIEWELRPASRKWKAELGQTGVTTFVYAGDEPTLVRWIGDLAYAIEM